MASKLTSRVQKLEAHAGALQGHRALIVRLENCAASMCEQDYEAMSHRLVSKIPDREEADTIIIMRDFAFPNEGKHLEPVIAQFQWQTWGNR